jgi:heme/copper-type cytochrome/quinol oxidase subunit 2
MLTLLETFDTLPVGWQLILTLISVFVLIGTVIAVSIGLTAKKSFAQQVHALNRQAHKHNFSFIAIYEDDLHVGCAASGQPSRLATAINLVCEENTEVAFVVIKAALIRAEKEGGLHND